MAADGGLVLALGHGAARPVPLILLTLALAGGYALVCLARPTRRCPKCKGKRVIQRGKRHAPCERCRATGRTRRLGATAIHRLFWSTAGERITARRQPRSEGD